MGIAVENVSKLYGSFRAVDQVSIFVKTGSLVECLLKPRSVQSARYQGAAACLC